MQNEHGFCDLNQLVFEVEQIKRDNETNTINKFPTYAKKIHREK